MTANYGNIEGIKVRLLIPVDDTQYDTDLTSSLEEACAFVNTELYQYTTVPATNYYYQISYIAMDIGAALFRRRHFPDSMDTGWWIQGKTKLDMFIDAFYIHQGTFDWDTNDPVQVMASLDKGIINKKEARTLLAAMTNEPTNKTDAEIDLIEKQIELIDAQIAKIVQDGLMVEAETLNVPKMGEKIDAETSMIEAETTKLSGADTLIITEQISKIAAEVDKLSGADTDKIEKEIEVLTAQITLLGKQGTLTDAQTALITSQKAQIDKLTEQLEEKTYDETITYSKTRTDAKVVFPDEEEE